MAIIYDFFFQFSFFISFPSILLSSSRSPLLSVLLYSCSSPNTDELSIFSPPLRFSLQQHGQTPNAHGTSLTAHTHHIHTHTPLSAAGVRQNACARAFDCESIDVDRLRSLQVWERRQKSRRLAEVSQRDTGGVSFRRSLCVCAYQRGVTVGEGGGGVGVGGVVCT